MSERSNGVVADKPSRAAITETMGAPGLVAYGGVPWEEWDKRLQGSRGLKAYRQMLEGDPICAAMAFGIEAMIRAPGHSLEDADASDEAKEITAFVETCFGDLYGAWGDTLSEALSCLWLGFSLFEVAYKVRQGNRWTPTADSDPTVWIEDELKSSRYNDGRIGWAYWSPRSQDTVVEWHFDPKTMYTTGFTQDVYTGIPGAKQGRIGPIPLSRCLHFRIQPRKQSPVGLSLFRGAYNPWYYAEHLTKVEAITAEKSGVGTLKLYAPVEKTIDGTADKAALEKMISNFHVNEQQGFLLPSEWDPQTNQRLWDAELMASPGQNVIDLDKAITRHNILKLMTLEMQFAMLGQGSQATGSYAQTTSQIDFFMFGINVIQATIADAITTQGIDRLVRLNGWPVELAPTFRFNPIKRRDLKVFFEAFNIAAQYINTKRVEVRRILYDELEIPVSEKALQEEIDEEMARAEEVKAQMQQTPPAETEPTPPAAETPADETARQATEGRRFAEGDDEITEADLAAAAAWFDQAVPEAAGLLDAEVVKDETD